MDASRLMPLKFGIDRWSCLRIYILPLPPFILSCIRFNINTKKTKKSALNTKPNPHYLYY